MAYKIAICDGSDGDRSYIAALARQWAEHSGHLLELAQFVSAENFLFEYSDKNDYDILLLDIEMGEMDGVKLAKHLRREDETLQIVFITGYCWRLLWRLSVCLRAPVMPRQSSIGAVLRKTPLLATACSVSLASSADRQAAEQTFGCVTSSILSVLTGAKTRLLA